MQRTVEQLDPATREPLSRWPTARRAQEAFNWISDPSDIVACCALAASLRSERRSCAGKTTLCRSRPNSAGRRVSYVASSPGNSAVTFLSPQSGASWRPARGSTRTTWTSSSAATRRSSFRRRTRSESPPRATTSTSSTSPPPPCAKCSPSEDAEATSRAFSLLVVLPSLLRGSYDIAHGWIKFKDPELNRRFCGGAAAKEEPPDAGDSDDDEVVPPPKQKKSDQFLTVK